ncbi:hypothetical protein SAMN02745912_00057 [Paramaledivibacter caminithermalis DSM 15212]|jgi:hypothetical protein|uniref:Uncharacterized protein n=1 Tax=Paramaledivibacter caminithermalis (strain DSM 15212 / CIP 107654 / DViRD3) TaxID=1121301 RepID=A0A1M6JNF7_PARC5|nr:hypothetical protein SAMN02745912_00057 [Paramaledivibacter caminithermalis DSM 15212]
MFLDIVVILTQFLFIFSILIVLFSPILSKIIQNTYLININKNKDLLLQFILVNGLLMLTLYSLNYMDLTICKIVFKILIYLIIYINFYKIMKLVHFKK